MIAASLASNKDIDLNEYIFQHEFQCVREIEDVFTSSGCMIFKPNKINKITKEPSAVHLSFTDIDVPSMTMEDRRQVLKSNIVKKYAEDNNLDFVTQVNVINGNRPGWSKQLESRFYWRVYDREGNLCLVVQSARNTLDGKGMFPTCVDPAFGKDYEVLARENAKEFLKSFKDG